MQHDVKKTIVLNHAKGRKFDEVETNPQSTSNHEKTSVGSYCQFKVEEMIKRMIAKKVAPLKSEIEALKAEVTQLRESQGFISTKYDNISREYTWFLKDSIKQKVDITERATSTKNLGKK